MWENFRTKRSFQITRLTSTGVGFEYRLQAREAVVSRFRILMHNHFSASVLFIQNRPRVSQVRCVEAFGELSVNSRQ